MWPFDLAWGTNLTAADATQAASTLFAASLFPSLGFLFYLGRVPRAAGLTWLTNFGFRFLLVFVAASIPAGIYCKAREGWSARLARGTRGADPDPRLHPPPPPPQVTLGKILADVDWVHGSAEALLTATNLFVVLGLRQALREAAAAKEAGGGVAPGDE